MNRSTMVLLALLAVMGAIVLWVLPGDDERMTSYTKGAFSFSVDSASIVKVSIARSGKQLAIDNVGGRWTITSHGNLPADPAIVTELIGGLSRFRPGSLVSTNAAKQALFQVDSSGSLVTLTDRSGASQSIVIGKMGPSFSEVYFRMPAGSEVYLGSGITTWSLEREVKDWRDKTIFASPAEAIKRPHGFIRRKGAELFQGQLRVEIGAGNGSDGNDQPDPDDALQPPGRGFHRFHRPVRRVSLQGGGHGRRQREVGFLQAGIATPTGMPCRCPA